MYPKDQLYFTVDLTKEEHQNDARKNIARKTKDNNSLIWSTRDCAQARALLKKTPGVKTMSHDEALALVETPDWKEEEKTLDN